MKQTVIISAFPGCGKSYVTKHHTEERYKIIDSDSTNFSWIKDEQGNNTSERNPLFPQNYMEHIKDNIGKVDVIFVSSHRAVRTALKEQHLKFILVSPRPHMKKEWIRRFDERGNSLEFIDFISKNWIEFIDDISKEKDQYCMVNWLDKNHLYLDEVYLDFVFRSYIPEWGVTLDE